VLVEILHSLIQINPFFRPTAKECLKNPIFDHIRNPKLEKTSVTNKIKLDIDQDDAFDYASGVSTKY
jgi:serine/threonine protein kinase